jgi:hypothetical protein
MYKLNQKVTDKTRASRSYQAVGGNFFIHSGWALMFSAIVLIGLLLGAGLIGSQANRDITYVTAAPVGASLGQSARPSRDTKPRTAFEQPKQTMAGTSTSGNESTDEQQGQHYICNLSQQRTAEFIRNTNISAENAYHQAQLALIEATGALTRMLNPSLYQQEIDQENGRHTARLADIESIYQEALAAAHCL